MHHDANINSSIKKKDPHLVGQKSPQELAIKADFLEEGLSNVQFDATILNYCRYVTLLEIIT